MYDNKPQSNINISYSPTVIFESLQKINQEYIDSENEKKALQEAATQRESDENYASFYSYINENANSMNRRSASLQSIKEALVSDCLIHIFKESMVTPITNNDEGMINNIVRKFVREHGAWNLINDFSNKNLILSEVSRICTKYYDRVLEADQKLREEEDIEDSIVRMEPETAKDFYSDMEDIDIEDATKMIKDRVSDAITDFVDSNVSAKLDYKDVLDSAKDQIDTASTEESAQWIAGNARRKIAESEALRDKSVYHLIVEAFTKRVLKNERLQESFVVNGKVDMDEITNRATITYTMLEMCNTLGITKMNEASISDYISKLQSA